MRGLRRRPTRARAGIAILAVLVVLLALLVLCAPFLMAARNASRASSQLADSAQVRLALDSAAREARLQLERSHPSLDDTPWWDDAAELALSAELDASVFDATDERGVMWDAEALDLSGEIDMNSAPPQVFANLLGASTRLNKALAAGDSEIAVASTKGFPPVGFLWIGRELVGYAEVDGGTFRRLQRGLGALFDADGNPLPCGPQPAGDHPAGEPVIDQRAFAPVDWRSGAGGTLRNFEAREHVRLSAERALGGLDEDALRLFEEGLSAHAGLRAGPLWQRPVRVIDGLVGGQDCDLPLDDNRWFNPGTLVEITDGETTELGLVVESTDRGARLRHPVANDYSALTAVVRPLARRPVNVNTASARTLELLFANVQLAGVNSRVTLSEARDLAALVVESRPFTGAEDYLRRVLLPASGLEELPDDAPVTPDALAANAALQGPGAGGGLISADDAVALYANALNANDSRLLVSTLPFAFVSRDVYAFDLRASVNAQSGVERGSGRREQVEVVVPQRDPLTVAWGRQEDFEEAVRLSREARHWTTGPNAVGVGGDRTSPSSRVRANFGAWADGRYVAGTEDYDPNAAGVAAAAGAESSAGVEHVFANREDAAWALLEPSRSDELGRRAGRVLHFDFETRDPEGRFLPDEPLALQPWDERVQWQAAAGQLLRALDLSLWIKPALLAEGVILDLGGDFLEIDRLTLEVAGNDLVLTVRDAAGDHTGTVFEERAQARYSILPGSPFGGAGLEQDTWTHVNIDVRGTRPDQISMLVDGQAHGVRTFGLTRLLAPLDDGDTVFTVENDEGFPERGVVRIGRELIEYTRAGTSFTATRFTSGGDAGFGGRMARVDFELASSGADPGSPTVLTSGNYSSTHPPGAPVELYGYSLALTGDVAPGDGRLATEIGPFAVGIIESVVGAQTPQGDEIPIDLTQYTMHGLAPTSQATGLVLQPADPNMTQADALSAFSTIGGYVALVQFVLRVDQVEATSNGAKVGSIEILRYSGRDDTTLFINQAGRAALPDIAGEALAPQAFIVDFGTIHFGGDPNLIEDYFTSHVFVVPLSIPVVGAAGSFGFPQNANGSELAQITHIADAENTEWVRYDTVAGDHLVRNGAEAMEDLYSACLPGFAPPGIDPFPPPPPPEGSAPIAGMLEDPVAPTPAAGAGSGPSASPSQGTGGPNWLPTMYEPTLIPDQQYVVTYAVRTALQHRGVCGTLSLLHPPNTSVLPAFRVLRPPSEWPDFGMPGRHDAAFLFNGNDRADLGAPVHVHRAYRPNEIVVASYDSTPQPNPVPTAGATEVHPEDPWMVQHTWVALEAVTGPVPATIQPGQGAGDDMRDVARLVLPPSGELPRATSTLSIGGSIRGAGLPPMVVDEVVFGDADVGDSFGQSGLQGGQFVLASALGIGALSFSVEPQMLRTAGGLHIATSYFLQPLPSDAGLLRIGGEIVCYDVVDPATGAIQIATGGRAMLGTTEESHEVGSTATFLEGWTVSTLSAAISASDATLPLTDLTDFPREGTLRVGEELVHYSALYGAGPTMPRLSSVPGRMDRKGGGLFRGRFGSPASPQAASTPVILHPFRYWDRWADRADAPELAYFGVSFDQPNAFWRSSFFEAEEPSSGMARVEVLQRVTQSAGQPALPWDAEPEPGGDLSLLEEGFEETQGRPIGTQADRLEWRAYVRFQPGAFDPAAGASHGWKQTPRLRLLGAEFLAPDLVLRRVDR
jgi:type II secretory pathway pseudopilin PulG